MKIIILGQTPAQKNDKQVAFNPRTKKPFIMSSKKIKDWQKDASKQLMSYRDRHTDRVKIDYMFYVKDKRKRDIDNMVCTINDALQAADIISGDHWQVLEIGSAKAELDTESPRAEITITAIA